MGGAPPLALGALPAICNFGRYELLGRLAVGGMAEIYLAREGTPGGGARHLVIKKILPHVSDDPKFVRMFMAEARLAMRLNHPNICHLYEFGKVDGRYFIAMEWIDGVPLARVIRRARRIGGIPLPMAVRIAAEVAEALHYAHRLKGDDGFPLGIVHRDVSPQNILVSYTGAVKLLDFGIAKAYSEVGGVRTAAGEVKGKFAYMSPEQCLGADVVDGRSDVFALGVCLYEALTARNLYKRKTQYETMREIIEGPVPSARAVRAELSTVVDGIVMRALTKAPEARFQTAGEMQEALERFLAQEQHVVHRGRIAEVMERLFDEEIRSGPTMDSSVQDTPEPGAVFRRPSAPAPAPAMGAEQEPITTPAAVALGSVPAPAQRRWWPVLLALVGGGAMLAAAAVVAWIVLSPGAGTLPDELREMPPRSASPPTKVEPVGEEPPELPIAPEAGGDPELGDTPPIEPAAPAMEQAPAAVPAAAMEQALSAVPAMEQGQRPAAEQAPRPMGLLSLNTRPWSKVYVGPRLIGTTPIGRAEIRSGTVRLRLVDRDGTTHQRTVRVEPGEETRAFFDLGAPQP